MSIPPIVLEWSRGLAGLSLGVVPCRGLHLDEWRETHQRCCEFVDRWGVQAHEAGWDTLRLFGVSPTIGAIRGAWCGVLVPLTVDVHEVTPEVIRLGKWKAPRRDPVNMPGMIPVWESTR